MKLVDILAKTLTVWPDDFDVMFVTQDSDGCVYGWRDNEPMIQSGTWTWADGRSHKDFTSWRPGVYQLAEDRKEVIVTRAQWQAAVDALRAEESADPEIDWSKAPEDATHFSPAYEGYNDLWAKTDGNRWMYRSMNASKWHYGPPPEQDEYYVERPLRPAESLSLNHQEVGRITRVWNGEGLPPIGIKVDVLLAGNGSYLPLTPQEWQPMTMKYKSVDFCVFEREDGQEFPMWNPQYSKFRPIRTAEQIAAKELRKIIESGLDGMKTIDQVIDEIIDAGYRKQVQP